MRKKQSTNKVPLSEAQFTQRSSGNISVNMRTRAVPPGMKGTLGEIPSFSVNYNNESGSKNIPVDQGIVG